jgi:hypothetical protein
MRGFLVEAPLTFWKRGERWWGAYTFLREEERMRTRLEETARARRDEVFEEARTALEALWGAFDITYPRSPFLERVARVLDEGETVFVWPYGDWTLRFTHRPSEDRYVSCRKRVPKGFRLRFEPTGVEIDLASQVRTKGRMVFFEALSLEEVRGAFKEVTSLRPLFARLDLFDLEEALGVLAELEEGELRREGPYFFVRRGEYRALHKGSLLGNPDLDARLFLGERVVLRRPGHVGVALKREALAGSVRGWLELESLVLFWEGKPFPFRKALGLGVRLPDEDPIGKVFGHAVRKADVEGASTRMRGLVEELREYSSPLKALEDPELLRRATLRALSLM